MGILNEKEDLQRTMKMFESLNERHRLYVSGTIDAFGKEELMQKMSDDSKELQEA